MPHGVEGGVARPTPGNAPPPTTGPARLQAAIPSCHQCEPTSAAETFSSASGRTSTRSCQGM
jgi:hypothetical protein